MLLGKRPRLPIRRSTSMTGITVDVKDQQGGQEASDMLRENPTIVEGDGGGGGDGGPQVVVTASDDENSNIINVGYGFGYEDQRSFLATVSPRNFNRKSVEREYFVETAHFLKTCGLCRRRLVPGRDIYMYRGDAAFCSLECREQQMKQDERKERCSSVIASQREGCNCK